MASQYVYKVAAHAYQYSLDCHKYFLEQDDRNKYHHHHPNRSSYLLYNLIFTPNHDKSHLLFSFWHTQTLPSQHLSLSSPMAGKKSNQIHQQLSPNVSVLDPESSISKNSFPIFGSHGHGLPHLGEAPQPTVTALALLSSAQLMDGLWSLALN